MWLYLSEKSEAFQHPDVGSAGGLPDGEVFAVTRLDSPSNIGFAVLEYGFHFAAQVDADEGASFSAPRRAGPETLAIRCPVDRGNANPIMEMQLTLGAAIGRNQPDF